MARLSDLRCELTNEYCFDIYVNPNRGRCSCKPCGAYNHVRARYPLQAYGTVPTFVTASSLHWVFDPCQYPQLVLISGDYMIHAWVYAGSVLQVCEVYRSTHPDYLIESSNESQRSTARAIFDRYSPLPFQVCLRLLRKRTAKLRRDELRTRGLIASEAVPTADCYDGWATDTRTTRTHRAGRDA